MKLHCGGWRRAVIDQVLATVMRALLLASLFLGGQNLGLGQSTAEPGTAEPGTAEPGTVEQSTAEQSTAEPGKAELGKAGADESSSSQTPRAAIDFSVGDHQGRMLRPIGVYQSQLVDLVPKNFQPVSVTDLQSTLGASQTKISDSSAKTPLINSFFDVRLDGNLLSSDYSTVVIENSLSVPSRRDLGTVNLALRPAARGALGDAIQVGRSGVADALGLPRLLVDDQGGLIAAVDAADSEGSKRSELSFGWTFRGKQIGDAVKFDLRLPRTPQTRMVISVPRDVQLESAQGVLTESPGPPPDADVDSRAGDIHWYVLEAGGQNRVDLIARKVQRSRAKGAILVRYESKQYEIDLAGVTWTHRLTFELPDHRRIIRLRCASGTIANVRVSPLGAQHQVFPRTDGQSIIEVRLPEISTRLINGVTSGRNGSSRPSSGHPITLTISGNSSWELGSGICPLTSVDFVDPNVIWTEPTTQADVTVLKPLGVAQWLLPPDWQQAIQTPTQDDEIFLVAQGPPHKSVSNVDAFIRPPAGQNGESSDTVPGVGSTTLQEQTSSSWSQLRLSTDSVVTFEEAWFEMELESASSSELKGRCRLRCRPLRQQIVPIEIEVEPFWNIESIQIVGSGRQVIPKRNARRITVWPTANEFAMSLFEIELEGKRTLVRNRVERTTPTAWMVRPRRAVKSQIVSLLPPKLRRWGSESIMLRGRMKASDLSAEAQEFFQLNPDRLLLRRPFGEIPAVTVEPINDSAAVTLRCEIGRTDDFATEEIILRTETSRPVFNLTVLTGKETSGDVPYRWSLRRLDGSSTVMLAESSITHPPDDPLGKYEIDLENRDLREFELVGSRMVPIDGSSSLTFSLPSVQEASSKTAEVILSADWTIVASKSVGQSIGVQRVPVRRSAVESISIEGREQNAMPGPTLPQRLRYDPAMRPTITVRATQPNTATCLVWDQSLEVLAGSRMEDVFRLVAKVSSTEPVEVSAPVELNLVDAACNGLECKVKEIADGLYRVNPQSQADTISLTFRRFHSTHSWFRRCVIPEIAIDGEIMHQKRLVEPAQGSVIIWSASEDTLFLMPRNVSLGIGWLAAAILFCVAWSFSRVSRMGTQVLFVGVLLAFSASIIWWPWQLPILVWGAMPMAVAALLNSVIGTPATSRASESEQDFAAGSKANLQNESSDRSSEFSVSTSLGVLFCFVVGATAELVVSPSRCVAQSVGREAGGEIVGQRASLGPNSNLQSIEKIDVLVPMNERGKLVGDKVYLSKTDYQLLLDAADPDRPSSALFESADYRVQLSRSRDASDRMTVTAEIEADYQIRLEKPKTQSTQSGSVRLPFRAETLRRVELLGDEQTRIVRSSVDDNGLVTLPLPPGDSFRLRVTFSPDLIQANRFGKIAESEKPSDPLPSEENERDEKSSPDRMEGIVQARSELPGKLGADADVITEVRLAIPKIHNARLLIESSRDIRVESVDQPLGKELNRVEIGRYEADLGPSEEIAIRCFPVIRTSGQRPASLNRRYRISAGLKTTVIECEIDPPAELAGGSSFQLNVVGPRADSVSGLGWQIEEVDFSGRELDRQVVAGSTSETETAGGVSGGSYRLTRQASSQEPVRFIWQLPSLLNVPTSISDSAPMTIPEVRGVGTTRLTSTLFAVEAADQIRMTELTNDSTAVAIDEFLKAWRGYRVAVERVFRTEKEFPNLVLFRKSVAEPELTLRHDLHVAEKSMLLELRAELVDVRPTISRTLWQLPKGFRLHKCSVNGVETDDWKLVPRPAPVGQPASVGQIEPMLMDLALRDQRVNDRMSVEISGRLDRPQRGLVTVPRIEPSLAGQRNQIYRITRERDSTVELVQRGKPSGTPMGARWKSVSTSETDLVLGRVPVSEYRWISTTATPDFEGDQIRLARRRNQTVFPCSQTAVMRYLDGRWTCDALIEIPKMRCPDFVDLQMPKRWTSGLSVSDLESWVKEDSEDQTTSIIRVSCRSMGSSDDADAPDDRKEKTDPVVRFVISGTLDGSDQARVSVPKIQVLGGGQRSVAIAVPDRLTTEPIQWRTAGVLASRLTEEWFTIAGEHIASPDLYSFYSVNERSWSVDLEPLSRASVDPVVAVSDTRVFLGGRDALVIQRFDLLPETLPSISIRLPAGATCVGVWAAGREISIGPTGVSQPKANSRKGGVIDVPLTYSQLPQSIEVINRVPLQHRELRSCESKLEGIDVESRWLAYFEHKSGAERHIVRQGNVNLDASPARVDEWELALAERVVGTMDRSSDMLAERSREEVAAWLIPWISRYREISGRGRSTRSSDGVRWDLASTKMSKLTRRFLDPDEVVFEPLFSRKRWANYTPIAIVHPEQQDDPPVVRQELLQSHLLRDLMIKGITLMMVVFAVIAMWPFRGKVTDLIVHPAVWLGMVGLIGMLVAPQPVGVSLILLAATLPAIRYLKSMKPWRESSPRSSPSQVR